MKQGLSKAQIFEAVDAVFRSWWTIVAGACLGLAAAFTLLHYTDPVYLATTKIFVAPPKIPGKLVPSTVQDDITARLRSLRDAVLSRPYMIKLIDETFPGPMDEEQLAKRIVSIRSRVEVESNRESSFQIRYRDTDPDRAAVVVNTLADNYIAENARYRVESASSATDTLRELAAEAEARLEEKQKLVGAFELENRFMLESQLLANLQKHKSRQFDLDANEKTIDAEENRILDLRAQLERERTLRLSNQNPVSVDTPFAERLRVLNDELRALRLRYSESHPDCRAKQAQIEALTAEAERLGEPLTSPAPGEPTPAPARPMANSLEGRILAAEREILRLKDDQAKIRREILRLETNIERTPAVQQELNNLTRGLSVLQAKYNEYQTNVEAAAGAEKMEESQQGSRFEIIDRATTPVIPISPNRQRIFGACLVAGLLLFVGPVLARGFLRPVIYSENGLQQLADINLLVTIPTMDTPEERRGVRLRRAMNIGFAAVSAAVLTVVFVVLR